MDKIYITDEYPKCRCKKNKKIFWCFVRVSKIKCKLCKNRIVI